MNSTRERVVFIGHSETLISSVFFHGLKKDHRLRMGTQYWSANDLVYGHTSLHRISR